MCEAFLEVLMKFVMTFFMKPADHDLGGKCVYHGGVFIDERGELLSVFICSERIVFLYLCRQAVHGTPVVEHEKKS